MPPKDSYSIVLPTEEEARLVLWCLRYGINSWFSVEEEERNVVAWHADKLEETMQQRAVKRKRLLMGRALANAKSLDEVNAILEGKQIETNYDPERSNREQAEVIKQLDAMRDSDESDEQLHD